MDSEGVDLGSRHPELIRRQFEMNFRFLFINGRWDLYGLESKLLKGDDEIAEY